MDLDKAREALERIDLAAAAQTTAAVLIGLVAAVTVLRLIRRRRPIGELAAKYRPSRADRTLTFLGAAMASTMAAHTMWLAVGAHMPAYLKWGVITFVEINTVAAALRSRQFRLLHAARVEALLEQDPTATPPARERDVDGIAVWIIAAGSALLGFVEAKTGVETIARTVAPLIAAFSWERGLVGELRQYATRKASTIRWANPLEAAAVRFGLATPTDAYRDAAAADRARRLALVVDAGYRAGVTSRLPLNLGAIVDAYADTRYHRRLRTLGRRYGLNATLLGEVRLGVAALHQARTAVSGEHLDRIDAWGDPTADRKAADAAAAALEQTRADVAALAAELEQTRTAAAHAADVHRVELADTRAELDRAVTAVHAAEQATRDARDARGEHDGMLERLLEQTRADAATALAAADERWSTQVDIATRETREVRAELEKARADATPTPRPPAGPTRPPRVPAARPTSPAPAGPADPFITYADAISAVQAGIGETWKTRETPISQGEVLRHAGISGVPTQRRVKFLIESMATRDPMGAISWLIDNGVLTAEQAPTTPNASEEVTSDGA